MHYLFIPQLLSALVLPPCAVVWWREREGYEMEARAAHRHFALWAWVSDDVPPARAAVELVDAFGPLARLAAWIADYRMEAER